MRDREKLQGALAVLALADARAKLLSSGMDWTLRSAWTDAEIEEGTLRERAVCEISAGIAVARSPLALPSRDSHRHRRRAGCAELRRLYDLGNSGT